MGEATAQIGVLALQGSFREHCACLSRIPGVSAFQVKTKEQLARCDGLVLPGGEPAVADTARQLSGGQREHCRAGESTTMGLVAQRMGLLDELRAFAGAGKPMWGTCAGLILLADGAVGAPWRLPRPPALCGFCGFEQQALHGGRPWLLRSSGWRPAQLQQGARSAVKAVHAGQKAGGQALIGGIACIVSRNFFGAQVRRPWSLGVRRVRRACVPGHCEQG